MSLHANILAAIAKCPLRRALEYADALQAVMERYEIEGPRRQAHFLAQILHESARLRYTEEIWGPTAAQRSYEGRRDLGNTQPGDGYRFRGRGLIQLTGRANYSAFAEAIGADVVADPDAVARPAFASSVAGWYWDTRRLNGLADDDDVVTITKRINGGTNGIADRRKLLARATAYLYEEDFDGLPPKPADCSGTIH